jgi:hypothetical protein
MAIVNISPERAPITLPSAAPLGALLTPYYNAGQRNSISQRSKQSEQEKTEYEGDFLYADNLDYNITKTRNQQWLQNEKIKLVQEAKNHENSQEWLTTEGLQKLYQLEGEYKQKEMILESKKSAYESSKESLQSTKTRLNERNVNQNQMFYNYDGTPSGNTVGQMLSFQHQIPTFGQDGQPNTNRDIIVEDVERFFETFDEFLKDSSKTEGKVSEIVSTDIGSYDTKKETEKKIVTREEEVSYPVNVTIKDGEFKINRTYYLNDASLNAAATEFHQLIRTQNDPELTKAYNVLRYTYANNNSELIDKVVDEKYSKLTDEEKELYVTETEKNKLREDVIDDLFFQDLHNNKMRKHLIEGYQQTSKTTDKIVAKTKAELESASSIDYANIIDFTFNGDNWDGIKFVSASGLTTKKELFQVNNVNEEVLKSAVNLNDVLVKSLNLKNGENLDDYDESFKQYLIKARNDYDNLLVDAKNQGVRYSEEEKQIKKEAIINKTIAEYINKNNFELSYNNWKAEHQDEIKNLSDDEIKDKYYYDNLYYVGQEDLRYVVNPDGEDYYVLEAYKGTPIKIEKSKIVPAKNTNNKHTFFDRFSSIKSYPDYDDPRWVTISEKENAAKDESVAIARTPLQAYVELETRAIKPYVMSSVSTLHNKKLNRFETALVGGKSFNTKGFKDAYVGNIVELGKTFEFSPGQFSPFVIANVVVPDDSDDLDKIMITVPRMINNEMIEQTVSINELSKTEKESLNIRKINYEDLTEFRNSGFFDKNSFIKTNEVFVIQMMLPYYGLDVDMKVKDPSFDLDQRAFDAQAQQFKAAIKEEDDLINRVVVK